MPLLVAGGSALMVIAGLALLAMTPREAVPSGWLVEDILPVVALPLAAAVVGTLLAVRRPENRVGWYLLVLAVVASAHFTLGGYAIHGLFGGALPAAGTVAWVFNWWATGIAFLTFMVILMVPDGRIATRRGRAALWSLAGAVLLLMPSMALRPGPLLMGHFAENPYALVGAGRSLDVMAALGVLALTGALILLVGHFKELLRTSTGALAQQIKWIVWSGLLPIPAIVIWFVVNATGQDGATPDATLNYATRLFSMFALTMIPVSIGIAILRYRLYDIDFLINRTFVYGLLTGTLAAIYVGAVILTQAVLGPLTGGNETAIAGSTLLVVALFQPLRRRIRDAVDRRFYRSRYDAARTLDAFAARLRDEVDLDQLRSELVHVVAQTMRPRSVGLWLRRERR